MKETAFCWTCSSIALKLSSKREKSKSDKKLRNVSKHHFSSFWYSKKRVLNCSMFSILTSCCTFSSFDFKQRWSSWRHCNVFSLTFTSTSNELLLTTRSKIEQQNPTLFSWCVRTMTKSKCKQARRVSQSKSSTAFIRIVSTWRNFKVLSSSCSSSITNNFLSTQEEIKFSTLLRVNKSSARYSSRNKPLIFPHTPP